MQSKVEVVARYLLSLMLLVFGSNIFLQFMPTPEVPEAGGKFLGALMEAGYVFPFLAIVFLATGVMLLIKRWIGLALVLLAPMTVNILLFHFRFDLAGIGAGALLAVLQTVVAVLNRQRFGSLFDA